MNDPMVILGFALVMLVAGFIAGVAVAAYRQQRIEEAREMRLKRHTREAWRP